MSPTERFSLRPLPTASSGRVESDLLDHGSSTGVKLEGAVLEGAYTVGGDILLLTSEGTPFEEALHVTLLAPDLTLRDAVTVAAPYAPGVLRDVKVVSDRTIAFAFFGGAERLRVTVLESPARHAAAGPPGARRPLWKRLQKVWLVVEEEPGVRGGKRG